MGELLPLLLLLASAMSPGTDTGPPGKAGQWAELEQNARAAGMSPDWIRFLKAWAWHESKGNPRAANRRPSEAASALALYDRNRDVLGACPWGPGAYGWGSGGWYGLLPVSAVWAFVGTPALCKVDPQRTVFDPWESTLEAVAFAQRSMKREEFIEPRTWKILNRATAAPTLMDERPGSSRFERAEDADDRFMAALRALQIPAGFADQRVEPLPNGWNAYDRWRAGKAVA